MLELLRERQQQAGATLEMVEGVLAPMSFGNDAMAIAAAQTGVALYDRSHWGRIQVAGRDRLKFLHNQSTNSFNDLQPGQGRDTVILTSTARTIDLVSAYVSEAEVLLLVSPNRRQKLMQWLDRYIFFGDQVQLTDITASTAALSLIGPESQALLEKLGVTTLPETAGDHGLSAIAGTEVRLAAGSGLVIPGYTLILAATEAAELWQQFVVAGAVAMGDRVWEQLRIQQGRPKPDAELTEDYNPLEAGLWHTISLNKGCYIGQETIARLNTYQGVRQELWGVKLSAPVAVGTPVILEESKVGILTSLTETATGPLGLAYVKTKAGGAGLQVQVGISVGELVEVPFLTRMPQG